MGPDRGTVARVTIHKALAVIFDDVLASYHRERLPTMMDPALTAAEVDLRNGFFDDEPEIWDSPAAIRIFTLGFMTGLRDQEMRRMDELMLVLLLRRYDQLEAIGATT